MVKNSKDRRVKKSKHKGLTGYRLHLRRFAFSGGEGIRTIKFPLQGRDKAVQELSQKIVDDYEGLVGSVNLSTWLRAKISGTETYSLLDFYLDSLRAGVVFAESQVALVQTAKLLTTKTRQLEEIKDDMRKKNPEFYNSIQLEKFVETFGKKQVRTALNAAKMKKMMEKIFKTEADSQIKQKHTQKILDDLPISKGTTKQQNDFWRNEYGFDKKKLGTPGLAKGASAMLFPGLSFNKEIADSDIKRRLEHYKDVLTEGLELDDKGKAKLMEECLGYTNKYSAFSNYFNAVLNDLCKENGELLRENSQKVLRQNIWQGKEDELDQRVRYLVKQARKIKKPCLVSNWSDYRTSLGGKLGSWHSNLLRQEEEIKKGLQEHQKDMDKLKKHSEAYLAAVNNNAAELEIDFSEYEANMKDAAALGEKLLEQDSPDEALLTLYRDILANIRYAANRIYQTDAYQQILSRAEPAKKSKKTRKKTSKKSAAHSEEKKKTWKKEYKELAKDIYKIPAVPGRAARKRYEKFFSSLPRLQHGFELLKKLNEEYSKEKSPQTQLSKEKLEEKILKSLEVLRKKIIHVPQGGLKPIELSARAKHIISAAFREVYSIDLEQYKPRNRSFDYFYRSTRAKEIRGRKIKIELTDSLPELAQQSFQFLQKLRIDWSSWRENASSGNIKELLELLEIEKVRFALLADIFPNYSIKKNFISKALFQHFPKLEGYFKLYPKGLGGDALRRALQTAVFSEIRGTLQRMSRQTFVERSVIQMVKSDEKIHLGVIPAQDLDIKNGYLPHAVRKNWGLHIPLTKEEPADHSERVPFLAMQKKGGKAWKKKSVSGDDLFRIFSSKYQMQFLDNSFLKSKNNGSLRAWEAHAPTNGEHSLISEQEYKVSWPKEKEEPTIEKIETDNPRIFVAVPFGISKKKETDPKNKYLGIDVGEYGLGWSLINKKNGRLREIARGFIHEPTIRKIREYRKVLQERQARGTFAIPSTKLARLRKQAISVVRNRVHDLVLRYDAFPVYEHQISNFETGNGKVTAVYNSVKRADVHPVIPADKTEKEIVWGDKFFKNIGGEISAYATSYMCSKCHRSVYEYSKDEKNFEIIKDNDRDSYFKVRVGSNELLAFAHTKEIQEKIKKGKKLAEFPVNSIKAYARPSLKALKKREMLPKEFENKSDREKEWLQKRGNQGIFVCPYSKCGHIADADIQAARFIALRKIRGREQSEGENELRKLLDFAKKQKLEAVHFIASVLSTT